MMVVMLRLYTEDGQARNSSQLQFDHGNLRSVLQSLCLIAVPSQADGSEDYC